MAMWARSQTLGRTWSWVRGIRVAALSLAAGAVFLAVLGSDLEETYGLAALFELRGAQNTPPEVALIAIDRASAESLKLPFPPPWPRGVYAELIKTLSEVAPKAIVFDLYFDEDRDQERTSAENQEFALQVGGAGRVALLQRMVRGTGPNSER